MEIDLCNPAQVKELLTRYKLSPRKAFGQNFLINSTVPTRIAEASFFGGGTSMLTLDNSGTCALEIGPGLGAMTRELARLFEKVCAVEIDRGLIPLLEETLEDCSNVKVVSADFMKLDIKSFLDEQFGKSKVRICANLPYYITTPIIMSVLEAWGPDEAPQVITFTALVQNEVADRLCASAGSSEYGAITAALNLCGTAKKLFTVSAGSFYPAPKVTSAVVQITMFENGIRDAFPNLPDSDSEMRRVVELAKNMIRAAFAQRRKTLTNALGGICDKKRLADALVKEGHRLDVRGEKLSAADFINLALDVIAYEN